jgi:hypothetical protein
MCFALLAAALRAASAGEPTAFVEIGAGARAVEIDEDDLSYKVVQTIKGSYPGVGPLQCESTCEIKAPTPVCGRDVPTCALDCPRICSKHRAKATGFRYKICIEGCAQFCALKSDDCCEGFE